MKSHDRFLSTHSALQSPNVSGATTVVIHPGALGDVLLAVAALRRLRAIFPRHELCLCANEQVSRLLVKCGEIDHWLSIDGPACRELFGGTVDGELRDWVARCEVAVAWLNDSDGVLSAVFEKHGIRHVWISSPFSPRLTQVHQRDRFLEVIGELPEDPSRAAGFFLPDEIRACGRACLRDVGAAVHEATVLIHPGSGSTHKCAAPEILGAVIDGFRSKGLLPIVLEGPADRSIVEQVLRHANTKPIVLHQLSLMSLAGVLSQVQLFLGHDSGVTHLSALLGVRTVALFGPTDPGRWAPNGPHMHVIRGAPCSCQEWQAVSRCAAKPCLGFTALDVLAACERHLG